MKSSTGKKTRKSWSIDEDNTLMAWDGADPSHRISLRRVAESMGRSYSSAYCRLSRLRANAETPPEQLTLFAEPEDKLPPPKRDDNIHFVVTPPPDTSQFTLGVISGACISSAITVAGLMLLGLL